LLPDLSVSSDARRSREQAWTLAWIVDGSHLLSLVQCDLVSRVALVGMQLHRTLTWSPTTLARQTQRRDGVDGFFEPFGVVYIGPRDGHGQRHTSAVDHDMALRAQLTTIRRILAGLFAPPGAGTLALSSDARVQSIRPTSCSRCRRLHRTRLHTPACCQSRKRRQHVIPLPQPSSWGSISHGMPLFKTKTIPVSSARSEMLRGRPPLGLAGSGGNRGAMTFHNSSLTKVVLMPPIYHTAEVLLGALRNFSGSPQLSKGPTAWRRVSHRR
jgi:hypothetical protein